MQVGKPQLYQRRLVTPTLWLTLGTLGGVILTLVQTPILFRALSPADFGLWAVGSGIGVAIATLDFGLGAATSRFVSVAAVAQAWRKAHMATVTSLMIGLFLIGSILLLALPLEKPLTSLVSETYSGTEDIQSFYWSTAAWTGAYLLAIIGRAATSALEQFRIVGLTQFLAQLFVAVVSSTLALKGASVAALIAVAGAGALLQASVLLIYAYVMTRQRMKRSAANDDSRQPIKEMLRFSGAMQANGLTAFLNSQTDRLVIAGIAGTAAVPAFEAANTAVRMVRIIPSQLLVAVIPSVAAAVDLPLALSQVFNRTLQGIAHITFGLSGLVIATSPIAFHLWLGSTPEHIIPMTVSLVLANALNMLTGPGTTVLRTMGRPGLEIGYSAITTAVNVALSIVLGLQYGALGVVVATAIATSASSVLFLMVFHRVLPVRWDEASRQVVWRVGLGTTLTALVLMAASRLVLTHTSAVIPLVTTLALAIVTFGMTTLAWDQAWLGAIRRRTAR